MIRRPKKGMKVNLLYGSSIETRGGILVHEFDSSLGKTGTIIDIRKTVSRGHGPKRYIIELDPPNWGIVEFLGTSMIEACDHE